jgi:hypothetical protein
MLWTISRQKLKSPSKDETFDFEHNKEKLQKLVDEHGMKDYKDKFNAFMDRHKQEIQTFITEKMSAVSDVKDRITSSIKTGDFELFRGVVD